MNVDKQEVHDFWDAASCGEALYLSGTTKEAYLAQNQKRYELEPIHEFTEFSLYRDKQVLEVGVGLGADHQQFAEAGAILTGIDLTQRAIKHVKNRFQLFGLNSNLDVADAEKLPFEDNSFDLVYSWGVLHHSPDTVKAIDEVFRVLKRGGEAKIMIYHKHSLVGYMLWVRYALLKFRPWTSLSDIYAKYLESPGTKAYSKREAQQLFNKFTDVTLKTGLGHGDLLTSAVGQRHRGIALKLAQIFWPRWFFKLFFRSHGLFMLIRAQKP